MLPRRRSGIAFARSRSRRKSRARRRRVGAWLARIDATPAERHAYRGDAVPRDALGEALGDDEADVDTRMAAARMLRRRYGEDERALVRVRGDADVRARVEAAFEDHDDAERRLESLGPLFRAR